MKFVLKQKPSAKDHILYTDPTSKTADVKLDHVITLHS